MGLQFSVDIRNARLDAIETVVGASPVLKIFQGTKPANVTVADAGTVLATVNLPADWMAAANAGVKAMSGTWEDNAADAAGTSQYFRLYDSGGTCKMQGEVTLTGGGGVMTVDNTSFQAGQDFKITGFNLTDGNA